MGIMAKPYPPLYFAAAQPRKRRVLLSVLYKLTGLLIYSNKERKFFMRTKRIIAAILSATVAATAAFSVSALELTESSNEGSTEVTAHIAGDDEPGNVSYIIEIPDKLDFGTLAQPDNTDEDHFKDIDFKVLAKEVNGLENNPDWSVRVKVRDQNFVLDSEDRFFISQKNVTYPETSNGGNQFEYSVYIDGSSITGNRVDESGFNIAFFNAAGEEVNGSLRLNQNQLYGLDIKDIAGDYSGYMIFNSSLVKLSANN